MSSPPALVVVDVQRGFDDAAWGARNNPECERHIGALLARWRERGRPVVLVRHDSVEPGSPLRPGQPGNAFKDVVAGDADLVVAKSVHSSFHGSPSLHEFLRRRDIRTLYVCGITTNHCCETTARVGADLGYDVRFVLDATHAFDRADAWNGVVSADEAMRMTAGNLHGEFATVVDTAAALRA